MDVYNKHNTTWKVLCTVFSPELLTYQKSHSFAALTCSISDQKHLVHKYRTPALSMKYPLFPAYLLCQMYGNLTGVEIQVQGRRQKKFRRCLFTLSMKRKVRHFHVVVEQKRRRNQAQKSVIHVQSCCFAYRLNLYTVLLTLSLRSCRWIFKSLIFSAKQEEVTPFDVLT